GWQHVRQEQGGGEPLLAHEVRAGEQPADRAANEEGDYDGEGGDDCRIGKRPPEEVLRDRREEDAVEIVERERSEILLAARNIGKMHRHGIDEQEEDRGKDEVAEDGQQGGTEQ